MSSTKIPLTPLLLGLGGLIPFVALAALMVMGTTGLAGLSDSRASFLLGVYGAVILSFVGGARWGLALTYEDQKKARRDYIIAIIPALFGWFCLMLEGSLALRILCVLTGLMALVDYGLTCRGDAPVWYGRLRLVLGAVASLSLGLAGWLI
jgi:hypothetical protein